ncbi:MAG: hypothetical protein CL927_16835, partial [Deltaproteobacteria bacterium]|nr:hypothetical protein [Deltaproteobacteria bacterium]
LRPAGPPPECPDHADLRICAAETAIEAGQRSDPAAVREACLHIEAGRWRDECMFMAAERMHQAVGEPALAQTTWLCAHAGQFNHHCLKRIIDKIAVGAPPADVPHGWERVMERAAALQSGLNDTDPILAQQVVGWYYAEALDQSYAKTRVVQGSPLALLPEEIHPHVRAAAIERLVHASPNADQPLTDWIQLIDHAMASASPPSAPLPPASVESHPPSNLWGAETNDEADLPAVYWRGSARRLTTEDPAADRLICLMESLARNIRPASHELGSLTDHPDKAVRLTARRLAEAVALRRE